MRCVVLRHLSTIYRGHHGGWQKVIP